MLSKTFLTSGQEVIMGCNGKGSGVCLVLSGRPAWAVFLVFALVGGGAGKALAQAPTGSDDASTLTFGDQQVGTRSDSQPIHLQNTGKVVLAIKGHSSLGKLR
jgi:hypothetical protein